MGESSRLDSWIQVGCRPWLRRMSGLLPSGWTAIDAGGEPLQRVPPGRLVVGSDAGVASRLPPRPESHDRPRTWGARCAVRGVALGLGRGEDRRFATIESGTGERVMAPLADLNLPHGPAEPLEAVRKTLGRHLDGEKSPVELVNRALQDHIRSRPPGGDRGFTWDR